MAIDLLVIATIHGVYRRVDSIRILFEGRRGTLTLARATAA